MAEAGLVTIHTDGASRGNPGAAAFAYVIAGAGEDDIEEAGCLGKMTNNQAEYTALVKSLEHALELAPEARIILNSDSELMVKQMRGEYRVKNEELRPLYDQAAALLRRFKGGVTFRHVRRADNSRADALCNQALDGKWEPTAREVLARHAARTKPSRGAPAALPAATTATTKPASGLREQALNCLRKASAAWAAGKAGPAPEMVWGELTRLLHEHGFRIPDGRARSMEEE